MNLRNPLISILIFLTQAEFLAAQPRIHALDLFPFQPQHVHGATIVELPDGNLLAAWFQGSGERQADDVAIMGARFYTKKQQWSAPFLLADVPGFPDINPVLFLDPEKRLWLLWYTVLANQWESSLLKYRISTNYQGSGPPTWDWQEVIHMKPGGSTEQGIQADDPFAMAMIRKFDEYGQYLDTTGIFTQDSTAAQRFRDRVAELTLLARGGDWMARGMASDSSGDMQRQMMGYPRFRRLGWQTRNKPLFLPSGRMLLPLYADGFDFSLIAITDDLGQAWSFSEPIVGLGPVQPALLQRREGTIVALMRDNGPPPQRLMQSHSTDEGLHWSPVIDSEVPNPGSAADMVRLQDGRWLLVHNDMEEGRHSLALSASTDEGKSWRLLMHLEQDESARAHYPAIIQDEKGRVHVIYSFHTRDASGQEQKLIRHVWLAF